MPISDRKVESVSVIIPAKNEAPTIADVIARVRSSIQDAEIIVVNDGSTDNTATVAATAGAKVISHVYSMGNGSAIKSGARVASAKFLVFLDADGQHDPMDIPRLLNQLDEGYYLVVGARSSDGQASFARGFANSLYNRLATYVVGRKIEDLTSGFRAVRADQFREFLYLLPNGFSYPTTSTIAFFRAGYPVCYVPISVSKRAGKSHINIWKDGVRFLIIIFKIGVLYSPLKLFGPVSLSLAGSGLLWYLYTFLSSGRFTNMSGVLLTASVIVFMMGLISEQITSLMYRKSD